MEHELNFQVEISDYYCFFEAVAGAEISRRKLRHIFRARFGYVAELPDEIAGRELIASEIDRRGRLTDQLRQWDGGLLIITTDHRPDQDKYISAYGYFSTREESESCLARLRRILPPEIDRSNSGKAIVSFWSSVVRRGDYYAERESKTIVVPRWSEISSNYPARLQAELARVMELGMPANMTDARLMLWRGLPGTGKTWAIRALARQWSRWCGLHYVVDPALFLRNPGYMLDLLSKVHEVDEDTEDQQPRWNLLVLEDAGEFVTRDSRQQHDQALAKLLNLTDGLFGQGQRLMLLITTNEEVGNLHQAALRNGRCLANLFFPEFTEAEARRWFTLNGVDSVTLPKKLTLSDLYAALQGGATIENAQAHRSVGFTTK